MDTKTILDIVAIGISIVAIILSFYAASRGNKIADVANALVKTSNEISAVASATQMAELELDIRNSILNTKYRYEDIALQVNACSEKNLLLEELEKSALESYLTAYDDACGK